MPNPFDGLISNDLKNIHCNAMMEIVRGSSETCTLIFSTTKWIECPNCYFDPMLKRSSGKYKNSGPRPFSGTCPYCNGMGELVNEGTQNILAAPIYQQKKWCHPPVVVKTPDNLVATISLLNTYDLIKQAKEIVLHTELDASVRYRYQRLGEPLPCGLGMACVIETIWKRVES